MITTRSFPVAALLAVSVLGILGTGCSRRSQTVAGPSGPPPSAEQRIQQIQNDPNASEEAKRVRLQNARENSGPPVRR